jgi:hypothetical protein
MTQYAAGWYPDGSGRFAERYYDGVHWTPAVRDQAGRAGSDPVPGVTADRADNIDTAPAAPPPPPSAPATTTSTLTSTWSAASAASSSSGSWSGTSASSFQFGPAPTHASAYAHDPSAGGHPAPETVGGGGRTSVPPVRWLVAVGAAAVAALGLVLRLWR